MPGQISDRSGGGAITGGSAAFAAGISGQWVAVGFAVEPSGV